MIYRCGAKLAPRLFSRPGLVSPSCGRAVTFTKFPNIEQLLGEDGARSRAPERGRAVAGSRQPVFSERKIYNSLNLSLAVLRDLGTKYPFIRLSPPVVNINLHQVSSSFWLRFATHTKDKLDLLEAWNLLASHSEDIVDSDHVRNTVVSSLSQLFPECSYQQLADVLFNIRILYCQPDTLGEFTSLLDKFLTREMRRILLRTDPPTPEEIDQCLKVAFTCLRAEMEYHQSSISDEILSSRVGDGKKLSIRGSHNWEMLKILLTRHLELLTAEQLVFSLFLCGLQRKYPGCEKFGQRYPIPAPLYSRLSSVLPELSFREVRTGRVQIFLMEIQIFLGRWGWCSTRSGSATSTWRPGTRWCGRSASTASSSTTRVRSSGTSSSSEPSPSCSSSAAGRIILLPSSFYTTASVICRSIKLGY